MDSKKRSYFFLTSLLIVITISIVVFFITYSMSCWISPPFVMSDEGEKRPTMPIGQAIIAAVFSIVTGVLALIFLIKRGLKKN